MISFRHIKVQKPICVLAPSQESNNEAIKEAIILSVLTNQRVIIEIGNCSFTVDPSVLIKQVADTCKEDF